MTLSAKHAEVEVVDYISVLRRGWWVILLGVLCGVGLAVFTLRAVPQTYTATASVIVQPTSLDPTLENGRTNSGINLDTQAQIVTSAVVASRAKEALNTSATLEELVQRVSVSVPPNSAVLDIAYSAHTARDAQQGAHEFAEAYLANRRSGAQRASEATIESLQHRIASMKEDLQRVVQKIAKLPDKSADRSYQSSQRDLLIRQINDLNAQLSPLIAGSVNPGAIITDAQLPKKPSAPNRVIFLASGLVVGLLIGLIVALLLERRDHRIRTRRDIERLGLDGLVDGVSVPGEPGLALANDCSRGEPMEKLRNVLVAALPDRLGSVVVASVSTGTLGSSVATSLATALAHTRAKVALVSARTSLPSLDQAIGMGEQPGLADALDFRVRLVDTALPVTNISNLYLIPAGSSGLPFPSLLQGSSAQGMLAELKESFDFVIIDVDPVCDNASAQALAATTDGVLLVATAMKSVTAEVLEAIDQFNHVSVSVFGAVVATPERVRRRQRRSTRPSPNSALHEPPSVQREVVKPPAEELSAWKSLDSHG